MTETKYINRQDLTSSEVIRELNDGNRIIIEVRLLGKTMRMAIRKRDDTYYCDTPVKLFRYENEHDMRSCLERYNLVRAESEASSNNDAKALS